MATIPHSVRVDSDLTVQVKKHGINISQVLNETLRSMLENKCENGYYALEESKLKKELEEVSEKLTKVKELYSVYFWRMNDLIEEQKRIEKAIEENKKSYEDALIAERKSNLLRAINKAIAYHEYDIHDIEIAVATQLKEMKELSPEFNLKKQIEYYKSI